MENEYEKYLDILDELCDRVNMQKRVERSKLEEEWRKQTIQDKLSQVNQIVNTSIDQRQAYKLLIETRLIYKQVQNVEEVEMLCDVLFGLLRRMDQNHPKYENKIKDMLTYLIQTQKQTVNKKMKEKMKDIVMMGKIADIFHSNPQMKTVFRGLIEKQLKENIFVTNPKQKMIKQFSIYVDQQMVDGFIIPQIMKLLRRSENNVSLLLEFLENTQQMDLDYSQYINDILLSIFTYENESLRDKQLKVSELMLTKTKSELRTQIISDVQQKMNQQIQEDKKMYYFQMLRYLAKDQDCLIIIINMIIQNLQWMNNEEIIKIVQQILSCNRKYVLDITINNDLINKFVNNKVQFTIISYILLNLLFNKENKVEQEVINNVIEKSISNNMKQLDKLVTNYEQLLNGFQVMIQDHLNNQNHTDQLNKLGKQLFTGDVFINKSMFYQRMQNYESNQWFFILINIIKAIDINNLNQIQQMNVSHDLIQVILNNDLKYQFFCQNMDSDLDSQMLSIVIEGLYLNQYFQTVEDVNDENKKQKIRKLLQMVNNSTNKLEFQNDIQLLKYLMISNHNIKKIIMTDQQINTIKNYLIIDIDDNQQSKVIESLIRIDQYDFVFGFNQLFSQSVVESEELLTEIMKNEQIMEFKQNYQSELQKQTNQLKVLEFKPRRINIKDNKQVEEEIQMNTIKNNEQQMFYDEQELKQYQKFMYKQKVKYYQYLIQKYILRVLNQEKGQNIYIDKFYNQIQQLYRDKEFDNICIQQFIQLFRFKKPFDKFNNVLGRYGLGMIVNQQMTQEINDDLNKFMKSLVKDQLVQKIDEKQWLYVVYQICEYIIKDNEQEITSKQSSIGIINEIIKKESKYNGQCIDIVINQINSLSIFKETYQLLYEALEQMDKQEQQKQIHYLLNKIINISDNGQVLFMKIANHFQGFQNSLDIELKIRLLQQGNFSNLVQEQASILIKSIKDDNLNTEQIQNLKVQDIIHNNRENSQIWLSVLKEKSKNNKNLVLTIFKQMIEYKYNQIEFFRLDLINIFMDLIPEEYMNRVIPLLIEDEFIKSECVDVGLKYIQTYIQKYTKQILSVLDGYLQGKNKDYIQQNSMVLLGSCGNHLKEPEYKIKMKTLSEKILCNIVNGQKQDSQCQMAKCLPNLIQFFESPINIVKENMNQLKNKKLEEISKIYGCSYIISSMIKGLGIRKIEELQIIDYIKETKDIQTKLVLINCLQQVMQKLLEPYSQYLIIEVMNGFGDIKENIRQLALTCTKNSMSNLSSYGIKLILPLLLKQLEESQNYRSKIGKIWALGNMAYCSPKQLSNCLPVIVPKLSEELQNTNPQIRQQANESLRIIGSTIKNPEISDIIDVLIKSLSDPYYQNQKGLDILLKTTFIHYIDIPALSLVIPIIEYGLKSRDSNMKQDSSKLIATICTLIKDSKDVLPYIEPISNGLLIALNDPITEIRQYAAKASGLLCKKLGLQYSDLLLNKLYKVLDNATNTSIERAGCAQALAECYGQLGLKCFKVIIQQIFDKINNTSNNKIKEGYLGIFIYLHLVLEDAVLFFLQDILFYLVQAISDKDDSIRNLGSRIYKAFIKTYGQTQTQILLNTVQDGIMSNDYQKRYVCCQLLGNLIVIMKKIKNQNKDMDYINQQINLSLIQIYILKGDTHAKISNEASNIWKAQIDNTPKMLKANMTLLLQTMGHFLVQSDQIQQCAIQSLDEFAQKYSEQCLTQIMNIINNQITEAVTVLDQKQDSKMVLQLRSSFNVLYIFYQKIDRQLVSSSKSTFIMIINQIHHKQQNIIKNVHQNDLQYIIEMIVRSINEFIDKMGVQQILIDQCIQPFIDDLENHEDQQIINQFIQLSQKKIKKIIIPQLFQSPMSLNRIDVIINNTQEICKELYQSNTQNIVSQFFQQLDNEQLHNQISYCLQLISANLNTEHCTLFLDDSIIQLKQQTTKQKTILEIISFFFNKGGFELEDQQNDIMELLIPILFTSEDHETLQLVNQSLQSILNTNNKQQQFNLIQCLLTHFQVSLRINDIDYDSDDENEQTNKIMIPGLNVDNCLDPYINILVNSIAYGQVETIEVAIDFYNIILKFTQKQHINQYIDRLVGPIIRGINYKLENFLKIKLLKSLSQFYQLNLDISNYNVPLQFTLLRGINGASDSQLIKLYIDCILCLIIKSLKKNENEFVQFLFENIFNSFFKTRNVNYLQLIYNLFKKVQKFTPDQKTIKVIIDKLTDTIPLLYKNEKMVREKSKVIGTLAVKTKNQEIMKNYVDFIKKQFKDATVNIQKTEEVLHRQYLLIVELFGLIHVTEDFEMEEDQVITEMIQQTVIQLNYTQQVDQLSQQILKAIANNEESCTKLIEIEFIDELSKKWEEEELIMQSLSKIKTLLEE